MIYEYENHLIIEDKGKWKVRLSLKEKPREIEVTNLRSGQKFITRYNASILSDEDFLKDQETKGYKLI